jgi:hypothetical protein
MIPALEVPVGVVEVAHDLILDILRDIRDRLSVLKMSDIR